MDNVVSDYVRAYEELWNAEGVQEILFAWEFAGHEFLIDDGRIKYAFKQ